MRTNRPFYRKVQVISVIENHKATAKIKGPQVIPRSFCVPKIGNTAPDAEYTGVWVSDKPDMEYLWSANTLLALEIPADVLSDFQWFEEGELYRKWLIPAAILNPYGPPMVGDPRE